LLGTARTRIAVRATVPSDGAVLAMADSRPGDVPEVADAGWPALVRHLRVTDAEGHAVGVTSAGAKGWTLARPVVGPLTLAYEVDYAPLAARSWPAPREAAFADADHLMVIGRSLFMTTPAERTSLVRFALPRGWQVLAPWPAAGGAPDSAAVASTERTLAFMPLGGYEAMLFTDVAVYWTDNYTTTALRYVDFPKRTFRVVGTAHVTIGPGEPRHIGKQAGAMATLLSAIGQGVIASR
jgi:predicted metalloprotease with PDZ domain